MLERRPSWIGGNISNLDQPLLIGLTKLLQPRKVVEIGVASGWSGCLFIDALISTHQPVEYIGIDTSLAYYLDKTRNTGAAINELFPDIANVHCRLLLGKATINVLEQIGKNIELAFIDADHHHPWAILDLLTLLPALAPSSYVLLHDLNLSTFERHKHANRGPKYLYECWPFAKFHSSQKPPMIGAIQMPTHVDEGLLQLLLDTIHTPWEVPIETSILQKIATAIGLQFGTSWGVNFQKSFNEMNNKSVHSQFDKNTQPFINSLVHLAKKYTHSEEIIELLKNAILLFPNEWKLFHHLSVALQDIGDNIGALAASYRAVELSSDNPHVLSFHGQLLLVSKNFAEAERYMRLAIALDNNISIFQHRLIMLLEKAKESPKIEQ